MSKETIYIEADDEITTVIDKVLNSKDAIVAVVLPKRATVFQSVVNMKLLKKAAEGVKKSVVLISSESNVDAIAAVAGVHVAKSLTSKPAIPKRKKISDRETTISTAEYEEAPKTAKEGEMEDSVGTAESQDNDTIELDNTSSKAEELPAGSLIKTAEEKKQRKGFKIPDFSSFRLRMTLGIVAFVLVAVGWFVGFVVMPKATITINTDTNSSPIAFEFSARTGAKEISLKEGILPATKVEVVKENKITAAATGEKNVGEKASGTITLTNCAKGGDSISVPAGTGFSSSSLTFVTNEAIELGPAVYVGNNCISDDFPAFGAVKDVAVSASKSGEEYNLDARSYQSSISGVSAYGSAMAGGTTKKVKVVSSEDIQKARDQLKGSSTADALTELKKQLSDKNLQALNETIEEAQPVVKNSHAVDAEVAEFTVTQTVTYRMLGVSSEDIAALLDDRLKTTLGDSDKTVRSNGLDKAIYRLSKKVSFDDQVIGLQALATLGPVFDESALREELAGQKRGDIEKLLESRDGVRSVSVEYKPLWITTTPKSAEKITIVINELEEN